MAKVYDPVSRQFIDDGTPTTAVGGVNVQVGSTKPEFEQTVSQAQESPLSRQAQLGFVNATGTQLTGIDQQADVQRAEAADKARILGAAPGEIDAEEAERQRKLKEHEDRRTQLLRERAAAIDAEAEAHRKAGASDRDYYKGNQTGQILAAVLQGLGAGANALLGRSGPSDVERVINAQRAAHREALVADWEASKQSRELKDKDLDLWERERARIESEADRQSLIATKKRQAELDASIAKHGGDMADAQREILRAGVLRAEAEDQAREGARLDREVHTTMRSPTGGAGAAGATNRPLNSQEEKQLAAANEVQKLTAEQRALIEKNGGSIPLTGPDAEAFKINETAIKTAIAHTFSTTDDQTYKMSEELAGNTSLAGKIVSHLPLTNTLDNYKRALEEADKRASATRDEIERLSGTTRRDMRAANGTETGGAAAPAPTGTGAAKITREDLQARAWAVAHPKDPRSKEILDHQRAMGLP